LLTIIVVVIRDEISDGLFVISFFYGALATHVMKKDIYLS
jgi:hypothetical protein